MDVRLSANVDYVCERCNNGAKVNINESFGYRDVRGVHVKQ